ncbi:hypothetical protein ACVWXO_006782 [Bradyrhizobium sp. LM2.7]
MPAMNSVLPQVHFPASCLLTLVQARPRPIAGRADRMMDDLAFVHCRMQSATCVKTPSRWAYGRSGVQPTALKSAGAGITSGSAVALRRIASARFRSAISIGTPSLLTASTPVDSGATDIT